MTSITHLIVVGTAAPNLVLRLLVKTGLDLRSRCVLAVVDLNERVIAFDMLKVRPLGPYVARLLVELLDKVGLSVL